MAAIELGLVVWPFTMLLVGIVQLVVYQYTQIMLSNALYDSASTPETSLLAADQALYKADVCNKIVVLAAADCKKVLLVEMAQLSSVATGAAPITGGTFSSGASKDALMLRAALPVTQFIPFIPVMTARSSVVFRKP